MNSFSNIHCYLGFCRCIPSQSTATIKLELLPLTDGIITLDTLQIDVKEKGNDCYSSSSLHSSIMYLLLEEAE